MTDKKLRNDWYDFVKKDGRAPNDYRTGNYADYKLCEPHVCCGWMDLHHDLDYGVTKENPYFTIQPLYWDTDAVLVVTDESDDFVIIEPTAEEIVFDGTKLHGLVPRLVAMELVTRQDTDGPLNALFESMLEDNVKPKLVWDWVPMPNNAQA